jgi:hypothetical protein
MINDDCAATLETEEQVDHCQPLEKRIVVLVAGRPQKHREALEFESPHSLLPKPLLERFLFED